MKNGNELAVFPLPPLTEEPRPLAPLPDPPLTEFQVLPAAVLSFPGVWFAEDEDGGLVIAPLDG